VETVSRGVFYSTIKDPAPLDTNQEAYRLLLRFRFHAHAFVSTLTSYIFDTAIGIHFNGFMKRLEDVALKQAANQSPVQSKFGAIKTSDKEAPYKSVQEYSNSTPAADIFEIMDDHSGILDKILGGCMLRTQQRALSDLLEDILGIVLRLGSLVRDWKRGTLKDEDAGNQLQKLHYNFERKMITFVSLQLHTGTQIPTLTHGGYNRRRYFERWMIEASYAPCYLHWHQVVAITRCSLGMLEARNVR
jgi:hypothetical protein